MQNKTFDEVDDILVNLVLDYPTFRTGWYAHAVGLEVAETRFRLMRLARDGHISGRRYPMDNGKAFNCWAQRGYKFLLTRVNELEPIVHWMR